MVEQWKDISGYENIYQISDRGRVKCIRWISSRNIRTCKLMATPVKTGGKYLKVQLWKDKKPKMYSVHRLVAFAFIPQVKGKELVNHKDGNPTNNNVDNLEWCTHEENMAHCWGNGLIDLGKMRAGINNYWDSIGRKRQPK